MSNHHAGLSHRAIAHNNTLNVLQIRHPLHERQLTVLQQSLANDVVTVFAAL